MKSLLLKKLFILAKHNKRISLESSSFFVNFKLSFFKRELLGLLLKSIQQVV